MRKLLIVAPWMTTSCAAFYAISLWNRLPARMAVTFFMGRVTGWQAKAVFIPFWMALTFGCLTLFTLMLARPQKLRIREGPLGDPVADGRRIVRVLLVAHVFAGGLLPGMPGLYYAPQISPTVNPLGNGSSGSTTYCAKPVIHACPERVGTTAA